MYSEEKENVGGKERLVADQSGGKTLGRELPAPEKGHGVGRHPVVTD